LAFDLFPHGILVTARSGRVVTWNPASKALLGDVGRGLTDGNTRCCDLLGCGKGPLADACVTQLAFDSAAPLAEIRVDIARSATGAAWVTGARLGEGGDHVALELRPGRPGDRRRRSNAQWAATPEIRIRALGRTQIETREGTITQDWLERRSGQVLKYLVCERHRIVHTDEIADAIWPDSTVNIGGTVRHFIHGLRARLEPDRDKRGASSYVVSARGGYALDRSRVRVDADDFEDRVNTGLAAFARGVADEAADFLHEGLDLYRGDFLADEPYAEWVQGERARLRDLAAKALEALSDVELARGGVDEAIAMRGRLADLNPLDADVQREYLEMLVAHGRRTEGLRRYKYYRDRLQREFGDTPEFDVADLRPPSEPW
jgi:DNA-binding SARP family transcriptional activator